MDKCIFFIFLTFLFVKFITILQIGEKSVQLLIYQHIILLFYYFYYFIMILLGLKIQIQNHFTVK